MKIKILIFKIFCRKITLYTKNLFWKQNNYTDQSTHDKIVSSILYDISKKTRENKIPLCSNRSNAESHTTKTTAYKEKCYPIKINTLNKIISIDREKKLAIVEGGCTIETLCNESSKYNLRPCVVPEFKGITIGGTIAGGGVESTSFKHGLIENTILYYNICLGDGTMKRVSRHENQDLFYGNMWCQGTFGFITLVCIKLTNTSKFVQVNYEYFNSVQNFTSSLKNKINLDALNKKNIEFLEGIQISKDRFCIISGNSVEKEKTQVTFSMKWYWSKWFVTHALHENTNNFKSDIIKTNEYLFRWDRGIFWLGLTKLNPTFINRILFGWLFDMETHHTISRKKSNVHNEKMRILIDAGINIDDIFKIVEYNNKNLGVYPVWLCPIKIIKNSKKIFSPDKIMNYEYVIDVGIYGKPTKTTCDMENFYTINHDLEIFIHENCNGMKAFETACYYSEQEFRKYFDIQMYDNLRKKYNAEGIFPNIYKKIKFYN